MKNLTAIMVICILVCPAVVFGAAWTLEEGSDTVVFVMGYDSWNTVLDGDGNDFDPPTGVNSFDVAIQWEHGITDDFTLSLLVPYSRNWLDDESVAPDQDGIGDTQLMGKYRVMLSDPFALSIQGGIKFPGDYDATQLNTPGDGQHDFELGVVASRFFGTRFLMNMDLGYRIRTEPKHDEWFSNLELGVSPFDNFWVSLHAQIIDSLGGDDLGNQAIFPELEEDIIKAGISVNYTMEQLFIFGSYMPTIDGANTSKSQNIVLGIGYNF